APLNVQAVPTAVNFSGPQSVCAGDVSTYNFSSSLITGATYVWSVTPSGAGNVISSTNNSFTIRWAASFTNFPDATIHLVITNDCDQVSSAKNVVVHSLPSVTLNTPASPICPSTQITLNCNQGCSGNAGETFLWNSDAGAGTLASYQHFYSAGDHVVTL